MASTAHRCQQYSAAGRCAALPSTGIALLILGCLGCWQEVRYEPGKNPRSTGATSTQNIAVTKGAPSEVLPAGIGAAESEVPEKEPEIQSAVSSSELLGSSEAERPVPAEIIPGQPAPLKELPISEEIPAPQPPSVLPPQDDNLALFPAGGEEIVAQPASARTLLAVWQMSSKWSMAAALQAKGRDSDSYGERLEQAKYGAKLLGVALADLPTHEAGVDRLPKTLTFLLETAGPQLADELTKHHGSQHAALAELATKTHVLLLSYTPSSTRLEPVVASIRRAAEQSGLPESVWGELIDLLAAKAQYKQVKAAIFQLHQRAVAHLSGGTP